MPTGRRILEQAVLQQLAQFELSGACVSNGWDEISAELLILALSREVVEEDIVLLAIHNRLLDLANEAYYQHIRAGVSIENVTSPHTLAYGLQHNIFSDAQLRKITFEDGDTAKTFMKGDVDTICGDILESLKVWEDQIELNTGEEP